MDEHSANKVIQTVGRGWKRGHFHGAGPRVQSIINHRGAACVAKAKMSVNDSESCRVSAENSLQPVTRLDIDCVMLKLGFLQNWAISIFTYWPTFWP